MNFTIEDIRRIAIIFDRRYLSSDITEKNLESLRELVPNLELVLAKNEEELLLKTDDADALFVWFGNTPVSFCKQAKSLKWIHSMVAGVEHLLVPEIQKCNCLITNTRNIHAEPVSEYVLLMILANLKRLPYLIKQQEQRLWVRPWPEEVKGHRVAVLGMGAIGKEIVRKCKLMGFYTIAYKRRLEEFPYVDEVYTDPRDFEKVLAQADYVVNALPGNNETRNLMDKEAFLSMKKGAFFINVGRGMTVDHYALIWALQSGQISGAALDVHDIEPLPASSPLWSLQNVMITPHMAAESPAYIDRAFHCIVENLKRLKRGEDFQDIVYY